MKPSAQLPNGNIKNVKELGAFVATRRKQLGLTQADLVGLGSTGNRFISELENGKETIQLGKVMQILDLLGLDIVIMERK